VRGLRQRFGIDNVDIVRHPFTVATVLDPQLKRLADMPDNIRQAAYGHVSGLVAAAAQELASVSESSTAAEDNEPPVKRHKADTRSAAIRFLCSDSDAAPQAVNDFDAYLCAAVVDGRIDVNILDWWAKNQSTYPATAIVAHHMLAIPATSVQSERLFSATGRLISKPRSRLLPETVEMLVFLNKNNGLYK